MTHEEQLRAAREFRDLALLTMPPYGEKSDYRDMLVSAWLSGYHTAMAQHPCFSDIPHIEFR